MKNKAVAVYKKYYENGRIELNITNKKQELDLIRKYNTTGEFYEISNIRIQVDEVKIDIKLDNKREL